MPPRLTRTLPRKTAAAGLVLALMLSLVCASAARRAGTRPGAPVPRALQQEAYVWNHLHTAEVSEAMGGAAADFHGLRVLVLERPRQGPTRRVRLDLPALARTRLPLVLVMRIEGATGVETADGAELLEVARRVRTAGAKVRGIEIDHDCATAQLPGYARWLERLRRQATGLSVSVTALPTWLGSGGFGEVCRAVDEVVLQVHAIRAPTLFGRHQAGRDVARMAATAPASCPGGWRVALPTYRVQLRDGTPLEPDPDEVAAFHADLLARPPAGLKGVLWFRLPVAGDRSAWSLATLRAVRQGPPPAGSTAQAGLRAGLALEAGAAGVREIVWVNRGPVDARPPTQVRIHGVVRVADGINGWSAEGPWLRRRDRAPVLAPGERLALGWARGEDLRVDLH